MLMEAPVCLIENRPNGLRACPEALQLLSEIREPVVVVSIVGPYRTGKSYLMNRLAGKTTGFCLGSTVQAKTKGIWMWCIPYPDRPNQTLVLLDTEGLGDIGKGNFQNDAWIFALAVLLSSTLVYNSVGTIDQTALDKLHFVWAVRDFTLQLEQDGQPITEDDYLEHALELKKRKKLPYLEEMKESELEPEFVEQAKMFCGFVLRTSQEKTLPGGHIVTGNLLAKLVNVYVDTISRGKVPCLENAVLILAEIENRAALQEAVAHYAQLMEQSLQLPTDTLQELLDVHKKCEEQALEKFMARAFKDDTRQFQAEFVETMENKQEKYCSKNELKSSEICSALLSSLSENLEQNIKNGSYSRPGGHQEFLNDLQKVEKQFLETPKKGIMAGKILKEFLQSQENISKIILQSDVSLQEKDKEIADEKMKAKARELEQELQKQEMEMSQQKLENQKQRLEMTFQKLNEKMEKEREQMKAEIEKMSQSKLKEQKALVAMGFWKEANQLNEEIQQLTKKKEALEEPSWMSSIFAILKKALSYVMPHVMDYLKSIFLKSIKFY